TSIPGGWTRQDPTEARFLELAHFATSSQTEGREFYDTVVTVKEVETQVVAGMNYKLTIEISPSVCKIGEVQYSAEQCVPKDAQQKSTCVAVIYHVPWQNQKSVTSYRCEHHHHHH
uniref:Cystatin-2 n=1 Tax=Ornithodoros moubata TaxID=6938 RepID=UPI0001DB0455|nr:Chain A, Cystatin-2 [Ornithodoros moubata]3L0R_B Chain B, Cystatin-2 [Ornithodoros moubata]